jgi:hypothetical protein
VRVQVNEGVILTIASGGGTLVAEGVEDNPIFFGSQDEAGELRWGGILFQSAHTNNHFEYTEISYGGNRSNLIYFSGSHRAANLALARDASLNISNSKVTNSKGYGIAVHPDAELITGGSLQFDNNALEDVFPED